MVDHYNNGVEISNSTVSGPVAGGFGATANLYGSSSATFGAAANAERLLDELQTLILANTAAIAEFAFALRDLAEVRDELRRPAPDQHRLRDAVRRLFARVAPIAAAGALVMDIKAIIDGL